MRIFAQQSDELAHDAAGPNRDASVNSVALDTETNSGASADNEDGRDERPSSSMAKVAEHDAIHRKTTLGAAKLIFGANVERVHIDTCRASNAQADRLRNLVTVFVGGTGGIGSSTAFELFRRSTAPKAYIVGRYVISLHLLIPNSQEQEQRERPRSSGRA